MSKPLILLLVSLSLGAWFLLGEKKSIMEKVGIVLAAVFVFIAYQLMSGVNLNDIISAVLP